MPLWPNIVFHKLDKNLSNHQRKQLKTRQIMFGNLTGPGGPVHPGRPAGEDQPGAGGRYHGPPGLRRQGHRHGQRHCQI